MTDTQIVHNYRLDRESIYELCHELEPELARPTRRVHALPVSLQVMIALRYFASGSYMNVIGDAHGVSKMSVSRSIHSIAKKHCQKHWSIYIQYPMTNTER
jgi:DNA-directed RNA polymerase specialized sigma subunit